MASFFKRAFDFFASRRPVFPQPILYCIMACVITIVSGFERCCCGRPQHRTTCPVQGSTDYRDLLYLLACMGRESVPGHLILRGASPTESWGQAEHPSARWIFPLPQFITDRKVLKDMIEILLRERILHSGGWENVIDSNSPTWASRNLTFNTDSQTAILANLRQRRLALDKWSFLAFKLILHSFPHPADPLYVQHILMARLPLMRSGSLGMALASILSSWISSRVRSLRKFSVHGRSRGWLMSSSSRPCSEMSYPAESWFLQRKSSQYLDLHVLST